MWGVCEGYERDVLGSRILLCQRSHADARWLCGWMPFSEGTKILHSINHLPTLILTYTFIRLCTIARVYLWPNVYIAHPSYYDIIAWFLYFCTIIITWLTLDCFHNNSNFGPTWNSTPWIAARMNIKFSPNLASIALRSWLPSYKLNHCGS